MTQAIPKSIALIDYSHMTTAAFKAIAADSKRTPVQVAADTRETVIRQMTAIRSATEHVIVCLDSPPYWRKKIYPDYKGKRAEREPEFGAILNDTLGRVAADGYNIARAPEHEADDVIATLARIYSQDYHCGDVRIVGADKDALQCVSDSVRLFVPKGRDEFDIRGPDWLLKEYAVKPEDFALLLAIMGDASDNIPGIKGLGKGHGAKLIELYKNPTGMAVGLTAAVSDAKLNDKKLSAVWERFAAGMAELPKWWKLTTLVSDAPLDKHPLKYLERLPVQKLVEEPISDADDSAFGPDDFGGSDDPDWDRVARETEERERAELAKALPVEPAKRSGFDAGELADQELAAARAPRIGKDPNAEKVLAEAASARLAAANTNAPKTPERVAVTQARIETGNAAEQARLNLLGNDAEHARNMQRAAATAPDLDRHGVERPKMPYDPKDYTAPKAPASADTASGATEKESAPSANGAAYGASATAAPSAPAASQVVPPTQGPQAERMPMAVVPPPSWELATQPRSPSEMLKVAGDFFNSRLFAAYGNVSAVFAVISLGRELGLGMSQALAGFFIVEQRPYMSAALCRALVQRHKDCDYFLCKHSDEKSATWVLRRKSWPQGFESSLTYTWELATKAGLTTGKNRHNWDTKPMEMITKTAASKLGKRDFADATFGLDTESEIV